jgi:hypothetical protein
MAEQQQCLNHIWAHSRIVPLPSPNKKENWYSNFWDQLNLKTSLKSINPPPKRCGYEHMLPTIFQPCHSHQYWKAQQKVSHWTIASMNFGQPYINALPYGSIVSARAGYIFSCHLLIVTTATHSRFNTEQANILSVCTSGNIITLMATNPVTKALLTFLLDYQSFISRIANAISPRQDCRN